MRYIVSAIAIAMTMSTAVAGGRARDTGQQSAPSGQPPIIDREMFFGSPEISSATLSPDGRYVAFRRPWNGTLNIWIKKTADGFDEATRITAETKRPIPSFFFSHDSRYVLFVQDQGGDENYNVYAVTLSDAAAVPGARNLTEAKGARAIIYDVPHHDPDVIFVGLNDRDPAWHDLYEVKISTGARTLLKTNVDRIAGWQFDRAGKLRLALRTAANGDTEILRVGDAGFEPVYSCTVFEACSPVQFHPDNARVYMVTNRGTPDLISLVLFDPQTKMEELVEADPDGQVDFGAAVFSEKTGHLVGTQYFGETMRVYFRDKEFGADYARIQTQLPGMEISPPSSTADDRKWMVVASSDTEPGIRYLFDRDTKALTKQYAVFEAMPRPSLAAMKPIRYKSSDGLEIPAYLSLPRGLPARNLPLVVVPHGGPWSRDTFGYDAMSQFFANRGYAVLQPNFRGSTGYGETFLNASNNEWGGKMQDDLTTGVEHLVKEGIADPKRVAILGGSYGGYAALAGVAFTPDLYAAAVSIVGPSNLLTLLESIPPYWETGRKMFHVRMGDPTTPEGKRQLERQSPLFSAAKIRTPLLVVQGANDPRVKKAESDQIVVALRDRGFPVEYLVAPDEGHGFARPVNSMAMFAAIEKFLAKHLGGRAQETVSPEVAARLTEITVDPKTVTLPRAIDSTAVGVPQPSHPLVAGSSTYTAVLSLGDQSMTMESVNVVTEQGDSWIVTETAKMADGAVVDIMVLDKRTLTVRSREVTAGPVHIQLAFEASKVAGTVSMGGQETAVSADLGGALFADGVGAEPSIAALPLADGYATTFRNFDVQRRKVMLKEAKVAGQETVTVPAGTFMAWKVEITSVDGGAERQTVWVDTATRRVVKTVAVRPEMQGATATIELVK